MNAKVVALCSLGLVDFVHAFNPVPVAPVHRVPNVQAQAGGVESPRTMPSRGSAFLPATQGSAGPFMVPPAYQAGTALSATQYAGQETLPTAVQQVEQGVDMESSDAAWHEGLMGFAAGVAATLSGLTAAMLTYRATERSAPQQEEVELRHASNPAGALLTGATAAMLMTSPLPAAANGPEPFAPWAANPGGFQGNIPMLQVNISEKKVAPEGESDKAAAKRIKEENNLTKREAHQVAPDDPTVAKLNVVKNKTY